MRLGAVIVLVGLAIVGAVASTSWASESRATASTVKVSLSEFKIIPVPLSVPAGKVTFVVRNTGKLMHELVVLRTNIAPKALPVSGSRAKEIGRVRRIPAFPPGSSARRLTLTLEAGKYVLLCNMPGHYQAGQVIGFRVR